MKTLAALAFPTAVLAGCAAIDVPVLGTTADLISTSGAVVGTVTPSQTSGGVTLSISGSGLPHGLHGFHVHTIGRCDPPGFESAGAHWNPQDRQHGTQNPRGPHAGDLPNVTVSSSGILSETVVIAGTSLAGLADADGSALVLHAQADDYMTDPSGNSGARIACAVLAVAN
ncbi:MAG TPA: superoxide dismutase family protein [Sphingomicrobium sp.]|nr:superoxide dismutase family protein [Sphingomicrobium sp.]